MAKALFGRSEVIDKSMQLFWQNDFNGIINTADRGDNQA